MGTVTQLPEEGKIRVIALSNDEATADHAPDPRNALGAKVGLMSQSERELSLTGDLSAVASFPEMEDAHKKGTQRARDKIDQISN